MGEIRLWDAIPQELKARVWTPLKDELDQFEVAFNLKTKQGYLKALELSEIIEATLNSHEKMRLLSDDETQFLWDLITPHVNYCKEGAFKNDDSIPEE